jgi:hypothetical protein
MPTKLTFCDAVPKAAFRSVVEAALDGATGLDVAVAFLTRAGADLFHKWANVIGAKNCRLSVSVQFPTDLDALLDLSQVLGPQLYVHLKCGPQERVESSTLSSLLHSKVTWIKRADRQVSIFVGSHNWTSSALDGVNLEASTRINCDDGDPFEREVKSHLDACARDSVVFNPHDLEYYRSIQVRLYPEGPTGARPLAIRQFEKAKGTVLHVEGQWANKREPMLLYLPLGEPRLNKWFKSEPPTSLYLYLYPPGSLTGHSPPTVKPDLYQGEVTTHSRRAITGMPVNCQIPDLSLPRLQPVASGNIPERQAGVVAQAVGTLRHVGTTELPVYVQGHRPSAHVEPSFEEEGTLKAFPGTATPAPTTIRHYFTPASVRDGRFVFRDPIPYYSVSIRVPGEHLYPIPPDEVVRSFLQRRNRPIGQDDEDEFDGSGSQTGLLYHAIDIVVDEANEGMPFVYPVSFVFSAKPEA